MEILQDCTFLKIGLTIGMSNILVPVLFLNEVFYGKFNYFLKTWFFLSNLVCLLNQLNKVCTFLHNQTFKYIVETIVNMKRLVPLLLKMMISKNISFFHRKHYLKKNNISLINQINKVHTLSNIKFQYIITSQLPLIFKNNYFEKHYLSL